MMPADDDHVLLGRIEERQVAMQRDVAGINNRLNDLKDEFDKYVLHVQFRPIEAGFYGLAALILTAVIAAVVALVLRR